MVLLYAKSDFSSVMLKKTPLFEERIRSNVHANKISVPHKGIISMFEMKNLSILQHNKLIESAVKMDTIPLKLFELAVASIDLDTALNGGDPLERNTVRFEKKLIFKMIGVTGSNRYTRMAQQLQQLGDEAHFTMLFEKDGDKDEYEEIDIWAIEKTRWSTYDDVVEITFSNSVMPYLIDLKKNGFYTQYKLEDIAKMSSKYSVVLFKWLILNFNQFLYYKDKQNRTEKQKNELKNPSISVAEIRRLTDTISDYKRFYDLEKFVIKPAIEEINHLTNIDVNYEKIKGGRGNKVKGLQFFIDEKPKKVVAPVQDELIEDHLTKEERRLKENETVLNAQQSEFTKMLIANGALGAYDLIDSKLMLRVGEELIPMFELIEQHKGIDAVEQHIKYVYEKSLHSGQKIIDYVGYQIKATDQYLKRLHL